METKRKLSAVEEEFYAHLKRQLLFSGIDIRIKRSLYDICQENDILLPFGKDTELLKDIVIDFLLYKKGKLIAGIEVLDEENELDEKRGEKTLINFNFARLSAECFMVSDFRNLKQEAKQIKEKITS